ncbi:NADH dehydrogenase [ubiquinone] iron-sulfur protein 5-B [Bienertia sinuspersici]
MASGWGISGNKGRCYDFWIDFSECMSRCREPKDCSLLREDYLECLHHSKEVWPLVSVLFWVRSLRFHSINLNFSIIFFTFHQPLHFYTCRITVLNPALLFR